MLTFRGSVESLDEAINLCPKTPIAYYHRGAHYSDARNTDRAIADFSEVIRLDSSNPLFGFLYRADEYVEKSDYDRAISDYSEGIRLHTLLQKIAPQLQELVPKVFYKRAEAYAKKAEYERAIEDYTEAMKSAAANGDEPESDYYSKRAEAYMARNDYDKAIADYGEVAKSVSKYKSLHADALSARAEAYAKKRRSGSRSGRLQRGSHGNTE